MLVDIFLPPLCVDADHHKGKRYVHFLFLKVRFSRMNRKWFKPSRRLGERQKTGNLRFPLDITYRGCPQTFPISIYSRLKRSKLQFFYYPEMLDVT
jgi:hypothetical protein